MHPRVHFVCISPHMFKNLSLDVTDSVAYFALKIHSKKVFVSLQNDGKVSVPSQVIGEVQVAYATSAAVIFVFFDPYFQSFEGYASVQSIIPSVAHTQSGMVPVGAIQIRRATVKFSQVMHIKDEYGLRGRSLSTVRDGSRLGISAGRVLCRLIDKKAYNEDPVHYRDPQNFRPNVISGGQPRVKVPSRNETDPLSMNFEQYLEDFARRRSNNDIVPCLDSLVYR